MNWMHFALNCRQAPLSMALALRGIPSRQPCWLATLRKFVKTLVEDSYSNLFWRSFCHRIGGVPVTFFSEKKHSFSCHGRIDCFFTRCVTSSCFNTYIRTLNNNICTVRIYWLYIYIFIISIWYIYIYIYFLGIATYKLIHTLLPGMFFFLCIFFSSLCIPLETWPSHSRYHSAMEQLLERLKHQELDPGMTHPLMLLRRAPQKNSDDLRMTTVTTVTFDILVT